MVEGRFRKVIAKVAEGWRAGADKPAAKEPGGNDERFVMKPGEVTIIRGGGSRIDRKPGEKRGE